MGIDFDLLSIILGTVIGLAWVGLAYLGRQRKRRMGK